MLYIIDTKVDLITCHVSGIYIIYESLSFYAYT